MSESQFVEENPSSRQGVPVWLAGLGGVVAAVVVNLLVLAVGSAVGGELMLVDGGKEHHIVAGGVLFMSVVPYTVGFVLAVLLSYAWTGFLRVAQVVGGAAGFVSALGPLTADADLTTRLSLATMHAVLGVVVIVSLELVRRRRV